jgi:hypothetical protein
MSETSDNSTTEDGSMFETLADFFSVVALAAIVSVMMYGASLQPGGLETADSVVGAGVGPGEVPARRRLAVFLTEGDGRPRAEIRDATALLVGTSLSLAADESRAVAITIVIDLVAQLSGNAPVSVECVLDEQRSDALAAVFADLVKALQESGRPCSALGVF